MEELKNYFESKKLSDSTISTYIRNLKILNCNKDFTNLNFLKDTDFIDETLEHKCTNTKKNYYIAICACLTIDKKYKKLYDHYATKMNELNGEIKEQYKEGKKSTKESDNWISWSDVEKVKDELYEKVKGFDKLKKLTSHQYYELLKFVVLSLYTDIPPRRNDYVYMNICLKTPFDDSLNWLCISTHEFIFNKFKTSKKEGSVKIEIPEKLSNAISLYLKFQPLINGKVNSKTNEPFLVYYDCKKLPINGITYILNDCFKSIGKKISSSMLRHIYLTDKYGELNKEQEKDSHMMSHSVDVQQNVYVKKD